MVSFLDRFERQTFCSRVLNLYVLIALDMYILQVVSLHMVERCWVRFWSIINSRLIMRVIRFMRDVYFSLAIWCRKI